jgi:hypothetical protein
MDQASDECSGKQQIESCVEPNVQEQVQIQGKDCATGDEAGNISPLLAIDHDPCANGSQDGDQSKESEEALPGVEQAQDAIDVTAPHRQLQRLRKTAIHELLWGHAFIVSAPEGSIAH